MLLHGAVPAICSPLVLEQLMSVLLCCSGSGTFLSTWEVDSTNPAENYFFSFCFAWIFFFLLPWVSKLNYLIVWSDECQSKYTDWEQQCRAWKKRILPFPVAKIHLVCLAVLSGCPLCHYRLLRSERGWVMYKSGCPLCHCRLLWSEGGWVMYKSKKTK